MIAARFLVENMIGASIYIFVFVWMWLVAFGSFVLNHNDKLFFVIMYVMLFLVTALRFHTGYDWNDYEFVFNELLGMRRHSFQEMAEASIFYGKELSFLYLNYVVAMLGGGYIVVQVVSSSVLFYGVYKYLMLFQRQAPLILAVCFSFLVFTLYFSTVRQGLAVGFFFLFWAHKEKGDSKLAWLYMVFAIISQYSAVMYMAIYYLSRLTFVYRAKWVLLSSSLVLLLLNLAGLDMFSLVVGPALSALPGVSLEKLDWYLNERGAGASLAALIFVISFSLMVGVILVLMGRREKLSERGVIIYNYTNIFVFFQIFFLNYSIFRNRLLYVAMFFSLTMLVYVAQNYSFRARFVVWLSLFLYSGLYYFAFLNSASGLPFVPYQDSVVSRVLMVKDTGLDRLEQYLYMSK